MKAIEKAMEYNESKKVRKNQKREVQVPYLNNVLKMFFFGLIEVGSEKD